MEDIFARSRKEATKENGNPIAPLLSEKKQVCNELVARGCKLRYHLAAVARKWYFIRSKK